MAASSSGSSPFPLWRKNKRPFSLQDGAQNREIAWRVERYCSNSKRPLSSNAISPLQYRPANLGSGSLWRYSGSSWKLILIKLNPLLFFVFIEETPRESKKRKHRTSPEKDEGTLKALNVRANKYDQYISHNLMSRRRFFFWKTVSKFHFMKRGIIGLCCSRTHLVGLHRNLFPLFMIAGLY